MYRFAPSPTGDMHIGNLRAAIFNYICSLQDKSGFILRIEDTDKERNIEGKEKDILEILSKFGIKPEQIYIQSENLKFHRQLASKLLIDKKAFACFTDAIKGELSFEPDAVDSFVIMRADKTPTYNFACAVDDMLEGVTFVIRGEDHVSNTPKQDLIREGLGYTGKMNYAHLPILLNIEGKKMSKRENESSVKWLFEQGFLPEAIANYLILLGNKTPTEIFTIEDAVKWFDITKISRSPARFDVKKLEQINREHIKLASKERIKEIFGVDDSKVELVKFYTQESSLVPEIKAKVEAIYSPKIAPDEYKNEFEIIEKAARNLKACESFDEFKKELMSATNLKGKNFFMPLRALLTNDLHGPELSELYPLIKEDLGKILI